MKVLEVIIAIAILVFLVYELDIFIFDGGIIMFLGAFSFFCGKALVLLVGMCFKFLKNA